MNVSALFPVTAIVLGLLKTTDSFLFVFLLFVCLFGFFFITNYFKKFLTFLKFLDQNKH